MTPILRHIALLAVAIWLWGHVMLGVAVTGSGGGLGVLRPRVASALLVTAAVVGVSLIAMRRRNEDLLLASLGIGMGRIAAGLSVLTLTLEGALWWALA